MTNSLEIHASALVSPALGPLEDVATDILAETAFFLRHPTFLGHDGFNQTCGFIASCVTEIDPVQRLSHILHRTYTQISPALIADVPLNLHLALPLWVSEIPHFRDSFQKLLPSLDMPQIAKIIPYYGGKTTGLAAYQGAHAALLSGQSDVVIVGGIDTMVTPTILDARALAGLANTKSNSYGAIPSEAGAMQLLSRQPSQPRSANSRILSMATTSEPEDLRNANRSIIGKALKQCITEAIKQASNGPPRAWISDYNGDRYRAEELGFVIASLAQAQLQEPICPASSIGDVGAATLAVYSSLVPWVSGGNTDGVLITVGDPHGPRAAIICQTPEPT